MGARVCVLDFGGGEVSAVAAGAVASGRLRFDITVIIYPALPVKKVILEKTALWSSGIQYHFLIVLGNGF